jgi:hypothetical protein
MPGAQSRGLVQASITKGWDPRVIQGSGERIDQFDVDPTSATTRYVGRLPGGAPPDGYRDDFDTDASRLRFDAPVPFSTPASREEKARRMRGDR